MTVSVLVPYNEDGADRDLLWAWIRRRFELLHPDYEVVTGSCEGEWSKGAAVADAAAKASGDVYVICDADSWVSREMLQDAVRLTETAPWVMPHRIVRRLAQGHTADLLAAEPVDRPDETRRLCRHAYEGVVGGGIVVLRRDAYTEVGPPDPRFLGWGGEDVAWGRAMDTLLGPHAQIDADLWHLYHAPSPTWRQPHTESAALVGAYGEAFRCPRLMRALIAGSDPAPLELLNRPVSFWADAAGLRTRAGGQQVRFADHYLTTTDPDVVDALRRNPLVKECA